MAKLFARKSIASHCVNSQDGDDCQGSETIAMDIFLSVLLLQTEGSRSNEDIKVALKYINALKGIGEGNGYVYEAIAYDDGIGLERSPKKAAKSMLRAFRLGSELAELCSKRTKDG